MGLAALGHFVVNVGSKFFFFALSKSASVTLHSHGSRPNRVRKNQAELLLRFRVLLLLLLGYGILLLPVSFPSFIEILRLTLGYSETKQKTLEEIAAAFGDKVMLHADDAVVEDAMFKDDDDKSNKSRSQQVEIAENAV
jgi:hypothetical protein